MAPNPIRCIGSEPVLGVISLDTHSTDGTPSEPGDDVAASPASRVAEPQSTRADNTPSMPLMLASTSSGTVPSTSSRV